MHITSLKNLPHPAPGESLPYWFQGNFAAMFVLNYWLREFLLSAFANRFELVRTKATDAIVLQNLPLLFCGLSNKAPSTRIWIFLKCIFFYPCKKRFASTRGAFSKLFPSTRKRCDIRNPKTDKRNALA